MFQWIILHWYILQMSIETVEKDWGYGTYLGLLITAIRHIICLTFERSDHPCILFFPSGCAQIWEGLCISVIWNHSSFQNVSGVTHLRPFSCKWICKTIRPTYCSSDMKEKHENKGYNQCIIVNAAIGLINVLCNKYTFKI